ncbi:MAG TPA: AAA family ATPase, partial [Polyangiaceae bacterium]|nr:AAA family ATPase [Polyangiaceae bacterium]
LLATAPAAAGQGAPPIVLDEVTATLLGDRFLVAPSAHGHALVGEAPLVALGTPRTLLGKPAPFVGRDRELAALRALYDEVAEEGVARAALVVAPAGVGKSRLLQELVRELPRHERPPELWIARADPLAASATFSLVAQALRRAASLVASEPAASARQKLLARAERHLPPADAWRIAALLGEAIGVPFPDDDSPLLSAARQDRHLLAEQVQNAWVDFVRAETAQGPIVLLLEDVHWADPTSLRLVDLALGTLAERPFLVLASARPEVRTTSPELWANRSLQELRLPELTRRASEKMVEGALGATLAPEAIARLVEHAAGNAFFLEELIRAAAEGRVDGLPESVLSVVQLRLEALPPDARQLLRAASIFGETFPRGGLERLVSRGGPDSVEAPLSLLIDRELLVRRSEQAELAFRHALVREAAYAMLTDDDRRLGHRLAAEWLEAAGAGEPFVLAEHFERSDDPARAVPWYLKGSQQACWNDLRAVLHAASRGAACGAAGEALGELRLNEADALHMLGDLEGAKPCVEVAVALFPAGGTLWCAAKGLLLQLLVQLGHVEGAASHANELLATEPVPAAYHEYERAMLLNVQAYCYSGIPRMAKRVLMRYDEIRRLRDGTPAADQASRARDVFVAGQNVHGREVVAAYLLDGDPWRAEAAAARSLAYQVEMGSQLTGAVLMTCVLFWSAFVTGNLEEAIAWLEPTLKKVRARRLGIFTVLLGAMRGRAFVRLGRAAEARPELEGLRTASRPIRGGYIGLGALTELAQMELALLEYEGAKATAHRVLAQARGARFRSPALAVLAHVALAAGEPDEALIVAREAV